MMVGYNYLGDERMGLLSRLVDMVFGPDVYCDHGKRGTDGVCEECCNDLYGPMTGEVIDFHAYRDPV